MFLTAGLAAANLFFMFLNIPDHLVVAAINGVAALVCGLYVVREVAREIDEGR